TGRLPFNGPNKVAILVALVTEEPRPVRELNPNVPADLAGLVGWLLAKNPDHRPSSARVVADLLATAGGGHPGVRRAGPTPPAGLDLMLPEPGDLLGIGELDPSLEGADGEPELLEPAFEDGEDTGEWEEEGVPGDWVDELPGQTLGRYEVGELVGRGHH